jgi:PIN domain nuclease of toxin-antitoxin system
MSTVVADTHVIVWYLASPEKLSPAALAALDAADASGEPIYIASISAVEIVYLIEKERLPEIVFTRLLEELARPDSSLSLVPLDLALAQTIRQIPRADVPEMPDRIIAGTALHLGVPLVTKDHVIRSANLNTIW